MKLFVNKKHKFRFWLSSVLLSIFFMGFMSFGSFNPINIGFWLSILCAFTCSIFGSLFHVKCQSEK